MKEIFMPLLTILLYALGLWSLWHILDAVERVIRRHGRGDSDA
jgi:hypothetical protein